MEKVYFTCPQCGGHDLDEVVINATINNAISCVNYTGPDGEEKFYSVYFEPGRPDIVSGDIGHYECPNCWFEIPAKNEQELLEWLLKEKRSTKRSN